MTALGSFIRSQIEKQTELSTAKGKAKYKAYFVATRIYAGWRAEVDGALREAGCGKVISDE